MKVNYYWCQNTDQVYKQFSTNLPCFLLSETHDITFEQYQGSLYMCQRELIIMLVRNILGIGIVISHV